MGKLNYIKNGSNIYQNGAKRVPEATKMEPGGDQNEPWRPSREPMRQKSEKGTARPKFLEPCWLHFVSKISKKKHSTNHKRSNAEKAWKTTPTLPQNEARIYENNQKSMPKSVTKKDRKITKNSVFSRG